MPLKIIPTQFQFNCTRSHGKKYIKFRGWTQKSIEDTLRNPAKIKLSRFVLYPDCKDFSKTNYHGTTLAKVFFRKGYSNQYVVKTVDRITQNGEILYGTLVELSSLRFSKEWKVQDFQNKYLYLGKYLDKQQKKTHIHKK